MNFILPAKQVSVLCEEIGGNQLYKKRNEKAGNTAKLACCAALGNKGEQKAGGIRLQAGEKDL